MTELLIHSGKLQGRKLTLPEGEIILGRDETCQLRFNSTDVSRQHCVLVCAGGGIVVRDLGSSNGTFVNDVPVEGERLLHPGDLLRVGPMLFQVPPLSDELPPATRTAAMVESTAAATATRPVASTSSAAARHSTSGKSADVSRAAVSGETSKAAGRRTVKKATDDDIASWLTDGDSSDQIPTSDTTIISGAPPKSASPSPAASNPTAAGTLDPVAAETKAADLKALDKKAFRTVQEEAADIIRRHHEMKRKRT